MKINNCFLRQFWILKKSFIREEAFDGGHLRGNNRHGATFPLSLKNIYQGEEFGESYFFFLQMAEYSDDEILSSKMSVGIWPRLNMQCL